MYIYIYIIYTPALEYPCTSSISFVSVISVISVISVMSVKVTKKWQSCVARKKSGQVELRHASCKKRVFFILSAKKEQSYPNSSA